MLSWMALRRSASSSSISISCLLRARALWKFSSSSSNMPVPSKGWLTSIAWSTSLLGSLWSWYIYNIQTTIMLTSTVRFKVSSLCRFISTYFFELWQKVTIMIIRNICLFLCKKKKAWTNCKYSFQLQEWKYQNHEHMLINWWESTLQEKLQKQKCY